MYADSTALTTACEKVATYFPVDGDEIHALMALVARPVNQKELNSNPEAQKSLDVELEKLVKKRVGKVFEICVEKGSELPKGNPLRKFKGRTVFQRNNVQDENSSAALFSELGSSPATMEAGKVLDAYGSQPGHTDQLADGKQAYTQTTLKGTETWVRLPKNKYKNPVVKLRLALYGHPVLGGFWEQHCERMLKEVGFELVFPSAWPSVFWHLHLRLLLAVLLSTSMTSRWQAPRIT